MQAAKPREEQIEVRGARVHNLKNISVSLPINHGWSADTLVRIAGSSGERRLG